MLLALRFFLLLTFLEYSTIIPNKYGKIKCMKQQRLNGLSDGIFAIVMTLLAIELKVPLFVTQNPTSGELVSALGHMLPILF
jgi:uncharacterized membrane protein